MCDTDDLQLTEKNSTCTCFTETHSVDQSTAATSDTPSAEYLVSGMTCSHCVASVTEELTMLEGVVSVSIELNSGGTSKVTVASAAPLENVTVRAAVEEAGYALVES